MFGLSVAIAYGVIEASHLVFGLFFALLTVAAIRGLSLHVLDLWRKTRETPLGAAPPTTASASHR